MTYLHPRQWLAPFCALTLVVAGCNRDTSEADAKKPFTLPGAAKVVDSLAKKDYETTVAGLAEVKATVTEKTHDEYRRLRQKVLDQLVMEMGDSEPAKEAYRAIGVMETGR